MTPGQQAIQCGHALVEFLVKDPAQASAWYSGSNHLCYLVVSNEEELKNLLGHADKSKVRSYPFYEPDLENFLTALVLEPTVASRQLTKHLKLALK